MTSYTWTAAGQLASKVDPRGVTTDHYDAFGNLLRVDLPDGRVVAYEVDGFGRRVAKHVDGVLERAWLYRDGLNPVAELDAAGRVRLRFVYGPRPHVPAYAVEVTTGRRLRYVTDHLGSVRQVVEVATGTVVRELEYDPWGRVLTDTRPGYQPFGYAGGLYDPDTGLVRFGARDYDATVGR